MNSFMGNRRLFLQGMGAAAFGGLATGAGAGGRHGVARDFGAAVAALEQKRGGRLGVALLDVGSGRLQGHRLDERFALCSTFKLPLAAVVLREADQGRLDLMEWLAFAPGDWVSHAPVTQAHAGRGGMAAVDLAEAAQTTSDNVAANLLLRRLGGPAAFTQILRDLGDPVTRLDRLEPDANRVPPGEERDTTSPAAMAHLSAQLVLGEALRPASRARLQEWMVATETGRLRLRAGLPKAWRVGDKTGTALHPSMPDQINDVAVIWSPQGGPWVLSAYYAAPAWGSAEIRPAFQAVLAEVGRLALRAMQGPTKG